MRWFCALVLGAILLVPTLAPADPSPSMPMVRKQRAVRPLHRRRMDLRRDAAEARQKGGRHVVYHDRDGDGVPDHVEDSRGKRLEDVLDRADRLERTDRVDRFLEGDEDY